MQRFLVIVGLVLLLLGLLWPWVQKLNLFHLPGDIVYQRDGFRFYFPITSMIIISCVISVVIWLLRR